MLLYLADQVSPFSFSFPHRCPHIPHALDLTGRKTFVAHIGGVVHKVVDGIKPRGVGTRVLASRTTVCWRRLLWCVGDIVSRIVRRARLALEGVQETMPVPYLVDGGPSSIVKIQRPPWHGLGEYVAAILDIVGTGGARIDTRVRKRAEA